MAKQAKKSLKPQKPRRSTTARKPKAASDKQPAQSETAYAAHVSDSEIDDSMVTSGFTYGFRLLKPSLQLLRANIETMLILYVLPVLVTILADELGRSNSVSFRHLLTSGLIALLGLLWTVASSLTLYYFEIQAVNGRRPKARQVYWRGLRYAPRVIGAMFITAIVAGIGLVFFIVPGLVAFRRYCLAPFFVVDENLGIRQAMDRSAAVTKPVSAAVYGVLALAAALSIGSYFLGKWIPPYGSILGLLLGLAYFFAPALLYKQARELHAGISKSPATSDDVITP